MVFDWLFSEPLAVGAAAPPFELRDDSGCLVRLSDHQGKENVVLIFYPGDDTPICTRQACEIRNQWSTIENRAVVVYGVNPGSAGSHRRFREKHSLPYPLLVDEGQQVARLYHANGWIVKRTVYLIGRDGKVRFAQRGMPKPAVVLAFAD